MPLPSSMVAGKKPVTVGGLAPIGVAAAPAGGAAAVAPGAGAVAFEMQSQEQDNWCWAATATSVSHFYNSASAWTQCLLANSVLPCPGGEDCCVDGSVSACDVPWHLEKALSATSNLLGVRSGVVSFSDLTSLIGAGNPLGTRVEWSGGGGHFVVLHGWKKTTSGKEFVDVADPLNGSSMVPYGDFVSRYRSMGSWTHSYWTQP
jgi:Papain-like cysteine protease AvrRpt2